MKKVFALLLAVIMLLSMVACGAPAAEQPKTEENDPAKVEEATAKVEEAPAKEPTEMRLMWVGGSDAEARDSVIAKILNEFNATNPYNVKFVFEESDDATYKTKFPTLMTQNNMADVFFAWNYGFLEPYVAAGKVYCLDDALAADEEWASRYGGSILDGSTYDGKVYGVPHSNCVYPTYYNKAIFEECGVSAPTNWEEFMNVCEAVKAKGYAPLAMGGQDAWVMGQYLLRLIAGVGGSDLYNSIRYGTGSWEDPKFIEAGNLLQDLIAKGIFEDNFAGVSYEEALSMFCNGKAAMYHMGNWVTADIINALGAENVGVFYQPAYYEENASVNLSATDNTLCIAESCENKEAALALVKMFSDPKYAELFYTEASLFPATNVQLSPESVDPVTLEIMSISGDIAPMGPFDILLGANVGGEFNNISVAISTGKDVTEQFTHLQEYAEAESE